MGTGAVVRRRLASTSTYLKHESICLPDDFTPQGIKSASDEWPIHQPIVKCRKTR
jgi:hypothetical protein